MTELKYFYGNILVGTVCICLVHIRIVYENPVSLHFHFVRGEQTLFGNSFLSQRISTLLKDKSRARDRSLLLIGIPTVIACHVETRIRG